METKLKRSEYRSAFNDLGSTTMTIDRRCVAILTSIQEAFSRDSTIGAGVCRLFIDSSDNTPPNARLESPIGEGRFVRRWSISGREITAKLVFELFTKDRYDVQFWEPVWDIAVPAYDSAVSGTDAEAISFTFSNYKDDERTAAFSSALSILRALVD